jgi:hypothetical protein
MTATGLVSLRAREDALGTVTFSGPLIVGMSTRLSHREHLSRSSSEMSACPTREGGHAGRKLRPLERPRRARPRVAVDRGRASLPQRRSQLAALSLLARLSVTLSEISCEEIGGGAAPDWRRVSARDPWS